MNKWAGRQIRIADRKTNEKQRKETWYILLLFSHSVVSDSATPWIAAHQASLSFTISQSFLKFMSIESAMPSNHLVLCHPPSPPAFSLSQHQGLFSESALRIRWPKYWNFSLGISPSNEYSGLISFRIDWFYLLAVQGTRKSLLQHHRLKASILWHSVFFTVQLSHLYITTGKTTALTIQTFIGKVIALIFNTLSRVVIAFLPRSKCLFISWLGSPYAVILEPKKISLSLHCFHCFPIYFPMK